MGALKTFKHVNLGLEIHPDLSLDMCLSEVLQNRLKTVSLTPQDQKAAWFKEQALTKMMRLLHHLKDPHYKLKWLS